MGVFTSGLVAFALLTALTLPGLSWGDDSASAAEEEELTPCQKMMAKCRGNWGECFPREAYNGDACCQQGASFKCGDDAPKKLTPCEILKEKCTGTKNHFSKCFPNEGSKGDACCAENFGLKCAEEMTLEEGMAVDPVYAEAIKCELRAHPNLQSYVDCLPDMSECNMCDRKAWEEPDRRDILECPRNVECILHEIPDLKSPAPEFYAATSKAQQELILAEKLASATEPTTTTTGPNTDAASSPVPSLAAALLIGYMFPNIYWTMVL